MSRTQTWAAARSRSSSCARWWRCHCSMYGSLDAPRAFHVRVNVCMFVLLWAFDTHPCACTKYDHHHHSADEMSLAHTCACVSVVQSFPFPFLKQQLQLFCPCPHLAGYLLSSHRALAGALCQPRHRPAKGYLAVRAPWHRQDGTSSPRRCRHCHLLPLPVMWHSMHNGAAVGATHSTDPAGLHDLVG